jgi:hypothetical protein
VEKKNDKHPSVGKSLEIDQRAIKLFLNWLPDNWLPREQKPDFFIDYLTEIVHEGEPTGVHFAAQIKGFEEDPHNSKPLCYPFKTKHLKYYRDRVQHPVFLFLINAASGEGYWLFAQKFLKENVQKDVLEKQDSLTIHFLKDDDLLNLTKFKCLLPEAERFVRDIHPGSVQAALQKKKTELEAIDPRCSVSLSIQNGKEHFEISPNEEFLFSTNIQGVDEASWKDFFEKGSKLKVKREDFKSEDFALFNEMLKNFGDEIQIQCGKETPGSIHVISKAAERKIVPIDGMFRSGTKFLSFHGQLPDSPLSISFGVSKEAAIKGERFDLSVLFEPKKWFGQPILLLAYFDQIVSFKNAFEGGAVVEMEIFARGNSLVRGGIGDAIEIVAGMTKLLGWLNKCQFLARHFKVNPPLPELKKYGRQKMNMLAQVYDLLNRLGTTVPAVNAEVTCFGDKVLSKAEIIGSDKILTMDRPDQIFDFFGIPIRLGTTRDVLTDMELISQTKLDKERVKVVFRGTDSTKLTSNLI